MNNNNNPFESDITESQEVKDATVQFVAAETFNNEVETPIDKDIKPWFERFKGVLIIISFFVVQFAASIIMALLIVKHGGQINSDGSNITSIALKDMFTGMVIAESVFIGILIAIYNKRILKKIKSTFDSSIEFIIKLLGYYFLLWGATIAFSIIDTTLFPNLIEEAGANQDVIEQALTLTPSAGMLISICITAPIVEEFVFRYGIISKLLYGVNKYVAAVIAALIFSFAHVGFDQMTSAPLFIHLMIGYMGQALVFSYIYAREQSLVYPILIHIINNVQAVVLIIVLANLA